MNRPPILLALLPSGTVINETIFFSYLSILVGLIILAVWLRRKRAKKTS
ncbi:MAG TPA: hypothetical protein VFR65_09900 [Nitrososphaeraceae archaeon]|nr:hypothetical protein [Nitrososphaeraceae archaeon]HSL14353.1 hypothetical protein [Nitrososphaeraceae archaeon]